MDQIMTTESHEGILVVRLHGDVDLVVEDALRGQLAGLPADGATAMLLDLGDVPFLDCICLNILLALARRCARARVGLLLIGVNGVVRRVIQALALETLLTVVTDERTALVLASAWEGGPPDALPSPLLPRPGIPRPADRRLPGAG